MHVPKLQGAMNMGGFGLKMGVDASVNLTYDDVEELRENEIAGKFLDMTLDNLFDQIGASRETFEDFKTEDVPSQENLEVKA